MTAAAEREREQRRQIWMEDNMRSMERMIRASQQFGGRKAQMMEHAARELFEQGNPFYMMAAERLRHMPPTIEEFLDSKDYFRDQYEELWPSVRDDLIELNPDILLGRQAITEYLDGGATGTGKSFRALATMAYQTLVLACFNRPQTLYKLPLSTPIVIMFMSVSETVTRRVLYRPFRQQFTSMPFVRKFVDYDRQNEGELRLANNIIVTPALANVEHMVGQAVIGAHIDEANFMTVVQESKLAAGAGGAGGYYDQAAQAHQTIARRRKSRFTTRGAAPGCIIVSSSIRYKDDYLDRTIRDREENPIPEAKFYRKKQYEVQPQDRYSGETFRVLVGREGIPSRVLKDHEAPEKHYPASCEVLNVPIEYHDDFRKDPDAALRDVAGIASAAIRPFFTQSHKLLESVTRWKERNQQSWLEKDNVILAEDGMPQYVPENMPILQVRRNTKLWVHVDLSLTSDRCGIAATTIQGFEATVRDAHIETLPHYRVVMACSIEPSVVHQIDITAVRNWIVLLKTYWGFDVEKVTYDGFQSAESIRALRKLGIRADIISCDKTPEPYELTRTAFYEGRVDMPDNELAIREFSTLEINEKTGMIDHPVNKSKDLSDAIAASIFSASKSLVARQGHGITDDEGVPVKEARGRRSINRRRTRTRH